MKLPLFKKLSIEQFRKQADWISHLIYSKKLGITHFILSQNPEYMKKFNKDGEKKKG